MLYGAVESKDFVQFVAKKRLIICDEFYGFRGGIDKGART